MVKYVNKSIPFMSSGGQNREKPSEACLPQAGKSERNAMSRRIRQRWTSPNGGVDMGHVIESPVPDDDLQLFKELLVIIYYPTTVRLSL